MVLTYNKDARTGFAPYFWVTPVGVVFKKENSYLVRHRNRAGLHGDKPLDAGFEGDCVLRIILHSDSIFGILLQWTTA